MMKHYLLSEQDLDEILWEIEYSVWLMSEKIKDKFIHESEYRCENDVNEESDNLKERDESIEF